MVYNHYYEAYDALVQGNDGVLPDLYEFANLTISCHPANSLASLTVADVVALALVEVSIISATTGRISNLQPATSPLLGSPVDLEVWLAQAVVCNN